MARTHFVYTLLLALMTGAFAADTSPQPVDDGVRAEIVPLPPSKRSLEQGADTPKRERTAIAPPMEKQKPPLSLAPAYKLPSEPPYVTVLSGTLTEDLELTPQMSPVLIRGMFVIPEKTKLTIGAGTIVHLRADPAAARPTPGTPDPSKGAVLWVWGGIDAHGATGNPAELLNQEKSEASLLLYGANESRLEGLRLKGVTIAQSGGIAYWTNCELVGPGSYAMAAGAAIISQSALRKFGGIFATYDVAPWSLMIERSLFENCREGLIVGSNPGESRLVVQKNHFIGTQGAHIRAMPVSGTKKTEDLDILIGENWYGSAIPEEIDMRIVDHRTDSSIHARLNTRPPSSQPYTNIGAGMKPAILDAALKEQQPRREKLLKAHLVRQKEFLANRQMASKGL